MKDEDMEDWPGCIASGRKSAQYAWASGLNLQHWKIKQDNLRED